MYITAKIVYKIFSQLEKSDSLVIGHYEGHRVREVGLVEPLDAVYVRRDLVGSYVVEFGREACKFSQVLKAGKLYLEVSCGWH